MYIVLVRGSTIPDLVHSTMYYRSTLYYVLVPFVHRRMYYVDYKYDVPCTVYSYIVQGNIAWYIGVLDYLVRCTMYIVQCTHVPVA